MRILVIDDQRSARWVVKDILTTQNSTSKIKYISLLEELEDLQEYNQDTKMWLMYNKHVDEERGAIKISELRLALKD